MNVFSKPVCEESQTEKISYIDYYKKRPDLTKYKLPQLKALAKHHKLHVSGTKPLLLERVLDFFKKCKSVNIIQSRFRGHMVRFSFRIRGPAFRKRVGCVNDNDFITMDPLDEIEWHDFYSYTDEKGFTYGFSISSLIALFKQKGKLVNPYNREKIDFLHMNEIFALYKINAILLQIKKPQPPPAVNQRQIPPPRAHPTIIIPVVSEIENNVIVMPLQNNTITHENQELAQRMREIQAKPLNSRIQELFMEIDQLGNYTQASWFSNLSTHDYARYFRYLSDIWRFRGQLSYETKRRICSLQDPFPSMLRTTDIMTRDDMQGRCLYAMEHMVYTGVDNEYRKIGALHVLSVLTIVSTPARQSMTWLYESLVY
jgi:hypothetical protein